MQIGFVQQANGEDHEANLSASIEGIRQAAAQGAELVVLQELHSGRYPCQREDVRVFDLAEPIPGPTSERLARVAHKHGVVVVASIFERRAPGLFHNTAAVLDRDGTLAGRYRKMHIPDDPGYYEKFYFTPGDQGFRPIDTSLGRLGVLVCWDQWFPEGARLMTLAGAELLVYPTAIGWDPGDDADEQARQREAWITIQRAHAIANGLPVVSCNRVGHEPDPAGQADGVQFWGSSFICGPQGEILGQASAELPEVQVIDVDLARTETVRRIWPYLRDRRVDAYTALDRRYLDD